MICRIMLAFLLSFFLFKLCPVLIPRGEFYGLGFDEVLSWFLEKYSAIAFVFFWSIYAGAANFIFKFNRISFYGGSVIFGISYSFFEYPYQIININKNNDFIGILAVYTLSLIFVTTFNYIEKKSYN